MSFVVKKEHWDMIHASMMEALKKIEQKFGKTIPVPRIEFKEMGRTVGQAGWTVSHDPMNVFLPKRKHRYTLNLEKGFTMRINPSYLRDNLDYMLKVTVPHEIAHVASVFLFGPNEGRGHGRVWKNMMVSIGLPPERTAHSLDVTNIKYRTVKMTYYGYGCACKGKVFRISAVKHNKIVAGKYKFIRCPKCRGDLVYKGLFIDKPVDKPETHDRIPL